MNRTPKDSGPNEDAPLDAGEARRGDPFAAFAPDELHRYARHFALGEVGGEGQRRIRESSVLVVGAGGLGSPAALYLTAAGIGRLGVIDEDRVELSNLQRQILHGTGDVGRPKVESAGDRLREMNPGVDLRLHRERLTSANAMQVIADYDLVVDGSDNFPTRYLVNDACVLQGKPWVYGAVLRWEGQLALFGAPDGPCYRCLFREPPPPGTVPGCAEAGVMGALTGIIGSLQALEALKWILQVGDSAAGRLLRFDGLGLTVREVHPRRDPGCPVCGDAPVIDELIDYEWFCATGGTRTAGAAGADGMSGADAPGRPDPEDGGPREQMDPETLRAKMASAKPPLLIDIREDWEWAAGNLEAMGARHVPMDRLEATLDEAVDRELGRGPGDEPDEVVLYCQTGVRSARAMAQARERMRARGVEVRHLEGGYEAWTRAMEEP